jgi:esterase/lipase superfamily enzyme
MAGERVLGPAGPAAPHPLGRTASARSSRLIFVHGYNNRFGDAVFRIAQVVHDTDAEVTPILFT